MNILDRAKEVLLNPRRAWPAIETENSSVADIYTSYLLILAAIPAIAGFIGMSLIGVGGFGLSIRVPIVSGLLQMAIGYALSLAMVYVIALIVDALASTFGGQKNFLKALALIAYGSTAGMLGGLFNLIPSLAMVGLLAALYSVYLVYLGLPILMKCPQNKALPYTAVILVCGIIAALILGAVSSIFAPSATFNLGTANQSTNAPSKTEFTIQTPQGSVSVDTQQLEAWGKRLEVANQKLEEAQKSGDSAAISQAMREVTTLMAEAAGRAGSSNKQ